MATDEDIQRESPSPRGSRGELDGKVAVVTGGSRGIGYAVAQRFIGAGAAVVLVARSVDGLREATGDLRRQYGSDARVYAAPADVTNEVAVRGLFRRLLDELGRVDLVVNAAGVLRRGLIADQDLAGWNESLAVNLTGVFLCSREAVRAMLEQEPDEEGLRGHIIQIVSGSGVHGWVGHGAYAAAKHGVMGLSDTLRDEVRADGVKVSDVLPGMVATDMTDIPDFVERPKLEPQDVASAVLAVAATGGRAMVTRIDVRHRMPK